MTCPERRPALAVTPMNRRGSHDHDPDTHRGRAAAVLPDLLAVRGSDRRASRRPASSRTDEMGSAGARDPGRPSARLSRPLLPNVWHPDPEADEPRSAADALSGSRTSSREMHRSHRDYAVRSQNGQSMQSKGYGVGKLPASGPPGTVANHRVPTGKTVQRGLCIPPVVHAAVI